jgi:TfoX/Sxy family transcriptional regulator of competence genes
MPYDEDLANRLREQLAGEDGVTERRMFGGIAFLLDGNMSVAASGQGGLLVRVGPAATDDAAARPHARVAVMREREMRGWIRVESEGVRTTRQLASWVRRSVAFVRTLPPKA